jgi:hypothetical protein
MMFSANSSILKGATWRDARWTLALGNWGVYAAAVIVRFRALAPYALMELVLPGGSVMALLVWLYRRWKNGVAFGPLERKRSANRRNTNNLTGNCGRFDDRT